jgi:hypothetical protein
MIDIYAPMELDDGRPVTMVPQDEWPEDEGLDNEDFVLVTVQGSYVRGEDAPLGVAADCWYRRDTGIWDGGDAKDFFVLRNVQAFEPVVEEDWS